MSDSWTVRHTRVRLRAARASTTRTQAGRRAFTAAAVSSADSIPVEESTPGASAATGR